VTEEKLQTKDRLLDAAEQLFANRGFEEVSIRDLAAQAGVNVAAVNYHFQGKDNLFLEVVRRRFCAQRDVTLASLQQALAASGERPRPDIIIRAIVGEYLRGALISTGNTSVMALITREMHTSNDTRHAVVFKEMIAPIFAAFHGAMLRARPNMTEDDANWAIASVIGQVHHFIMRRVKFDSLADDDTRAFMLRAFPVLAAPIDQYVEHTTAHIAQFSTAAIDGMHPEVTP